MIDLNRVAAEAAAVIMPFVGRLTTAESVALWYRGQLLTLLATGAETEGQYALLDAVLARGSELPRHLHQREDEAHYLLEGQMTITVGNITIPARPGDCVVMPRGVPHSYRVETEKCRSLVLLTPAGLEGFIQKLSLPTIQSDSRALPPETDSDFTLFPATAQEYGVEWLASNAQSKQARSRYDLEIFTPGAHGPPSGLGMTAAGDSSGFPTVSFASSFA